MGRSRLFPLVFAATLASPAALAGTSFGHPTGTGKLVSRPVTDGPVMRLGWGLVVKARSVTWVAADGRTSVVRLPAGATLDALVAPRGEWTDAKIEIEGVATLSGDGWRLQIEGGTLSVALSEPVSSDGGVALDLSVELPAWIADEALAAPGGALRLDAAHPLYGAVWGAFEDGARAESF